jgi:hypothetical protein
MHLADSPEADTRKRPAVDTRLQLAAADRRLAVAEVVQLVAAPEQWRVAVAELPAARMRSPSFPQCKQHMWQACRHAFSSSRS